MESPRVITILVNWNGKADTLACLQSLQADSMACRRIIVVDNGSNDNSVISIAEAFPEVEVITTGANLGFTGGNNVGIERALEHGADYVFLLNNDTTVEPGAISALVAAAAMNPNAGLLTPVIHYFDRPEEPWFAGSEMDLRAGRAVHSNAAPPLRTDQPRSIPWASGCAMLIPSRVLKQLGGFDDRYFLNWEDVDLSLRVREAGFEILLVPGARIYHKVGRSLAAASGAGTYYYVRNHLLLVHLHVHRRRELLFGKIILGHLRSAVRAIWMREPQSLSSLSIVLRATIDFIRGRFGKALVIAFF